MALTGLLAVGACGDDDEDASTGSETTETTTAPAEGEQASGDVDAWCENLIETQAMDPNTPDELSEEEARAFNEAFFQDEFMPAVREVAETAPEEVKSDVEAILAFFEEHGDAVFQDPQLGMQFNEVEEATNVEGAELCDAESVDVVAADYSFDAPAEISSGRVMFRLENTGEELHEMVVFRKKDDTAESFDELYQMSQEEAMQKVDEVTFAFAGPGGIDTTMTDLETGEYAMVCFIPVGLTPEAAQSGAEPQGPPHFMEGMTHEFTVG